jgi:hypothetical protein
MRLRIPPPTTRLAFAEMTPDDLDDMAALLGDPEVMRSYPRRLVATTPEISSTPVA